MTHGVCANAPVTPPAFVTSSISWAWVLASRCNADVAYALAHALRADLQALLDRVDGNGVLSVTQPTCIADAVGPLAVRLSRWHVWLISSCTANVIDQRMYMCSSCVALDTVVDPLAAPLSLWHMHAIMLHSMLTLRGLADRQLRLPATYRADVVGPLEHAIVLCWPQMIKNKLPPTGPPVT